jgi:hypothetical protein
MPILNMQRSLVELGRIRIGISEPTKSGRTRPAKLDAFRFTTPARDRADAVSRLFGGEVRPWSPDGATQQWEILTPATEIPVMVPPGPAVLSQWYELWSGGGCQRRCDGVRNILADVPCQCPPDPAERATLAGEGKACRPTTRVNVILRDLPGVGVWRLESHGYYAATELAGSAEFLANASATGRPLPAVLRLDARTVKRDGQTRRFAVPVLDIGATVADLLAGNALPASAPVDTPALPGGSDTGATAYLFRIAAASTVDALRGVWIDAKATGALGEDVPNADGELVPLSDVFDARRRELGG